ncbi:hypothetical protein KQ939_13965 [Planococcus sp. CP5-4]|uniref:hypothetical protein n=1 Tax=unclassified Planococcus (in: firmicutes) TaxID=2662419 RepID=UPI001C2348F0|nr:MULTISPECIES: hypothetical protein [unclassified Planococcus (in: firmicutes)]MBU9674041.1 hypothetical protein [Planococcus sp. CP5-4_YE]MBV0909912.1 hypothetical protein [Planococcus sp. CP5-4_UN]MBW6064792.1 hypothetical protein [Planococcus sp. CP5-4]
MSNISKLAGMTFAVFLLASCQETENPSPSTEDSDSPSETTPDVEETVEAKESNEDSQDNEDKEASDDSSDSTDDDASDGFEETQASPSYSIETYSYVTETGYLTAFNIERGEDEEGIAEKSLMQSLIENDPTTLEILGSYAELTVDMPKLNVKFTEEDGSALSTTSAQTTFFYSSLFGISDLYGIEEIVFTNPEGEENVIVAQRLVDKPLIVEEERGISRGYYTMYDKELEQTNFLAGVDVGEQVADENGEPLSFHETVEVMKTADQEGATYSSAMVEGLEVVDASLENDTATVRFTSDEETVTEPDLIVFETAMQLAALDFEVEQLRLINETLEESITYPFAVK